MDSLIRWRRSDYSKLSRAVSRYNKIVKSVEGENLPDLQSYYELKDDIKTRKELNRVINSLKRVNEKNLTKTISFDDSSLTEYEYNEIKRSRTNALRNLTREKNKILSERPSIGMGDERLSEIQAIEESIQNLENKSGEAFTKTIERINRLGSLDINMKKAITFRENVYTALEGVSSYKNYDVLKKKLDKIQNPLKFYEYVKQSPVLMDLFLWYKEKDSLQYGSFTSNEEAFDTTLLLHLGITDIKV